MREETGFFFFKFPGFVASPALPQLPLVLVPAPELGARGISAQGLAGDQVGVSKVLFPAGFSLLEHPS